MLLDMRADSVRVGFVHVCITGGCFQFSQNEFIFHSIKMKTWCSVTTVRSYFSHLLLFIYL